MTMFFFSFCFVAIEFLRKRENILETQNYECIRFCIYSFSFLHFTKLYLHAIIIYSYLASKWLKLVQIWFCTQAYLINTYLYNKFILYFIIYFNICIYLHKYEGARAMEINNNSQYSYYVQFFKRKL